MRSVKQIRSAIAGAPENPQFAPLRARPRVVFSRDNPLGGAPRVERAARIMIVDDDYLIAAQVEEALMDAGWEVVGIAETAEGALKLAAEERPALAIMDVRLAGARDGIDAAVELFARYGIRCVFATAHCNDVVRARAAPADPLQWVSKPYPMPLLVAAVRRALQQLRETEK
jgi:two-component system, response regulator PdtaR